MDINRQVMPTNENVCYLENITLNHNYINTEMLIQELKEDKTGYRYVTYIFMFAKHVRLKLFW